MINEYTVQVTPGDGSQSYYLRFSAPDEATVHRFLSDPAMRNYVGPNAAFRIAFVLPWFEE